MYNYDNYDSKTRGNAVTQKRATGCILTRQGYTKLCMLLFNIVSGPIFMYLLWSVGSQVHDCPRGILQTALTRGGGFGIRPFNEQHVSLQVQ